MGLTDYFSTVTVWYSYIKKWSVELFSENYSYSYIKKGFRIRNVMVSKRMVDEWTQMSFCQDEKFPCQWRREGRGLSEEVVGQVCNPQPLLSITGFCLGFCPPRIANKMPKLA